MTRVIDRIWPWSTFKRLRDEFDAERRRLLAVLEEERDRRDAAEVSCIAAAANLREVVTTAKHAELLVHRTEDFKPFLMRSPALVLRGEHVPDLDVVPVQVKRYGVLFDAGAHPAASDAFTRAELITIVMAVLAREVPRAVDLLVEASKR